METLLRWLAVGFGGLAALGLLSASVASNFQFGLLLADGPERYIYAGAGGFGDLLKTLLPAIIGAAWAVRGFVRAFVGTLVFLLIVGYSLTCAVGLYSIVKDARLGDAAAERTQYEQLTDERDDLRAKIARLDTERTPGAIEAEIARLKLDHKFDRSKQCENATVSSSIELCQRIEAAKAELADAQKAASLQAQLSDTKAKITGLNLSEALSRADPAAEAVARIIKRDADDVRDGLAVMIAFLIEFGSAFGFWLVGALANTNHNTQSNTSGASKRASRRAGIGSKVYSEKSTSCSAFEQAEGQAEGPAPGPANTTSNTQSKPVEAWAAECLSRDPSTATTAADLLAHHKRWAAMRGVKPASSTKIGIAMTEMGYRREKVGGRNRYAGAKLADLETGPRLAVVN